MLKLLRAFRQNRGGNIALMSALLFVPLMGAAGGAIDFARLQMVRSRLQDAVDAASVGAVAKNSTAMTQAATMNGDGTINAGGQQATQIFNANMSTMADVSVSTPVTTVTKSGSVVTSSVSARATMPTIFLRIFGLNALTTSGLASSTNGLPTFINFYLLLDNTPSMGVGATPADVATMVSHTPDQCAFACHDTSNANNYYNLAKSLGVTTRMDVLRTATQDLMTTAKSTAAVPNQFGMGIYTFGSSSAALGFTTMTPPITNLTTAATIAGSLDLMTVPNSSWNNDQDTDLSGALSNANGTMPNPGSGVSAAQPQEVLFLVSDGVTDTNVGGVMIAGQYVGGSRSITTVNASYCTTIKNRGIKIAVLYTTYLPLPTNSFYNNNVAPFVNTINPTMQSCASPGLFFEVSPTQGISQAMAALFQKVVANAHIVT